MSFTNETRAQLEEEKAKKARLARYEELEDRIFQKSMAVIEAHVDHYQISPDQQEPPPEWVEQYGDVGARQRLAVARMGWLPASQQPSGVKLAGLFAIGSMRARAYRTGKQVPQNLNVQINLPAPTSAAHPTLEAQAYPTKILEEG